MCFVECMCCYFDDLDLADGYGRVLERGLVSEQEVALICDFHALANAYQVPDGDDYTHEAILADSGWHAMVAAARQARPGLVATLAGGGEVALVAERSSRWRLGKLTPPSISTTSAFARR